MLLSALLTSLAFQCSVPRILSLLNSEVSFDNYTGIDKINRKVVRPCVGWNNGSFFCMFFYCFFLVQKHLNIHILLISSLRNNWEQDKTWSQATFSLSGMLKYYEHPLTLIEQLLDEVFRDTQLFNIENEWSWVNWEYRRRQLWLLEWTKHGGWNSAYGSDSIKSICFFGCHCYFVAQLFNIH